MEKGRTRNTVGIQLREHMKTNWGYRYKKEEVEM